MILYKDIMIINIKITLNHNLPLNQNAEHITFRRKKELTNFTHSYVLRIWNLNFCIT